MNLARKQKGVTLAATLVFLMLMTIVAVSATKISILDVLVSGNEQQQMLMFQQAENDLKPIVSITRLVQAYGPTGFNGNIASNDRKFRLAESTTFVTKIITDLPVLYPCERNGIAMSVGAGTPPCDLFDFQVRSNSQVSGAKAKHHRGAGKMLPNLKSNGSLL